VIFFDFEDCLCRSGCSAVVNDLASGRVICCVEVGYNGILDILGAAWLTCDVVDVVTNAWLSDFVNKKVSDAVFKSMLPIFIISWTMCWSWLCSVVCPHPGSGSDARFAPYSSSLVPFLPKYLPPKYLAVVIWKRPFSWYPMLSGGEWNGTADILCHDSQALRS
jgi:hypothetical protein